MAIIPMEYEEAIEWLYGLKHYIKYDEQADALNMAIEALGKHIPKKPIRSEHSSKCWCPSCNSEDEMDIYGTDFCPNCGQALDWNEEE